MRLNIDPLSIGAGLAIAIGAITTAFNPQQQAITAATDGVQVNTVAAEVAAESLTASAALAESRYKSGACAISTVPITEQMAVPPVYAGGIICDRHGTTAAIASNGHLVLLSRTGNQSIITEGLR